MFLSFRESAVAILGAFQLGLISPVPGHPSVANRRGRLKTVKQKLESNGVGFLCHVFPHKPTNQRLTLHNRNVRWIPSGQEHTHWLAKSRFTWCQPREHWNFHDLSHDGSMVPYMVCHGSHQESHVSIDIPAPWILWLWLKFFTCGDSNIPNITWSIPPNRYFET